jgi:hypothetical protein
MTGPCAKTRVRCTIVAPDGRRWVGENLCASPQPMCPRLPGEDYAKCRSVCAQIGHAEVVAAILAGSSAIGGVAYIEGHTYACESCKAALALIGVTDVRIQLPPRGTP